MIGILKAAFKEKKLLPIADALSFLFLCVFVFDCAITGNGKWLAIGPFSFRMICFALAVVFSLPLLWKSKKSLIKNPLIKMLIAIWCWIAVSAVIGILNGNDINIMIGDIRGYLNLLILPTAICIIRNKNRFIIIMKWLVVAAIALSSLLVALNVLYAVSNKYDMGIFVPVARLFRSAGFLFYDRISDVLVRCYMNSCPYLVVGCICALYIQLDRKRFSVFYSLSASLFIVGILFEYTRSLLFATCVAAAGTIITYFLFNKDLRKIIYKFAAAALCGIVLISLAVNYLGQANGFIQFSVDRVLVSIMPDYTVDKPVGAEEDKKYAYLTDRTANADNVREETLDEMRQTIEKSPLIGSGLGKRVECREKGIAEFTYHDILSKMGLIGLLLYFSPAIYGVCVFIKILKKRQKNEKVSYAANMSAASLMAMITFMVVTYFNPYLNAAIGLSCYCIMASGISLAEKFSECDENSSILL